MQRETIASNTESRKSSKFDSTMELAVGQVEMFASETQEEGVCWEEVGDNHLNDLHGSGDQAGF